MTVIAMMGGVMRSVTSFPSIELKLGKMRKAQSFTVNPWNQGDIEIVLQSDKRITRVNLETGKAILSNGKGHPGFMALNGMLGATEIQFTADQLAEVRTVVGWTPA